MTEQETEGKGTCFIIAPIGEIGSETRRRSDLVLEYIIAPAARECGYEPVRADAIANPGMITTQVLKRVHEVDLVIADLTGHNPNVFYELALRHAGGKPCIQIIEEGQPIPFDVGMMRTINVNHSEVNSHKRCRQELIDQIKAVKNDPKDFDNPITSAIGSAAIAVEELSASEDPMEQIVAKIAEDLSMLSAQIAELDYELGPRVVKPPRPFSPRSATEAYQYLVANWRQVQDACRGVNKTVEALLRASCRPVAVEDNTVVLGFRWEILKEKLEQPQHRRDAEEVLSKVLGAPYLLRCIIVSEDESTSSARESPLVKAGTEMGARIVKDEQEDTL